MAVPIPYNGMRLDNTGMYVPKPTVRRVQVNQFRDTASLNAFLGRRDPDDIIKVSHSVCFNDIKREPVVVYLVSYYGLVEID